MPLNSENIFSRIFLYEFYGRSKIWSMEIDSLDFAKRMDEEDPLHNFRNFFNYPKRKHIRHHEYRSSDDDDDCIYLCGHSLGLQPKTLKNKIQDVFTNWAQRAVESHFHGKFPAALCDTLIKEKMASLVGAEPSEVTVMNALTVNIHVLLTSFYNPTANRNKILMLDNGFPSDLYAVQSHVQLRGYNPDETIVLLRPKPGTQLIDPVDLLSFIEEKGQKIALIFLEGLHFYTGQLFDMKSITKTSHEKGCIVGFDLAHAVGNVRLHLHEWNVDFAVWCTYKYLNSGPGNLGSIFVHNRHMEGSHQVMPKMGGWWGIRDKFSMSRIFEASEGADRFSISNPSPFQVAMISASLDIFEEAGMEKLLKKQRLLTGYLEYLLRKNFFNASDGESGIRLFDIITPNNPKRRGSQISLFSRIPIHELENILKDKGIVCDVRKPSVIRIAPVPLYNTFTEIYNFVHILKNIFEQIEASGDEES